MHDLSSEILLGPRELPRTLPELWNRTSLQPEQRWRLPYGVEWELSQFVDSIAIWARESRQVFVLHGDQILELELPTILGSPARLVFGKPSDRFTLVYPEGYLVVTVPATTRSDLSKVGLL